ncbi:MAG: ATP phosphoribosyltransferase [Promethearchaeia archaeon]
MTEKKLKLTIPKGSLKKDVVNFFERAGLRFKFSSSRDYRPSVNDDDLEVKLLRPQEIPNYLIGEDEFDLGISGIDWVKETNADVEVILDLEIGAVRIVFCVPDTWNDIDSMDELLKEYNQKNEVLRLSTEYLTLSLDYIQENETYQELYGEKAPLVITPWRTWGENEKVKIFLSFGATEAKPPEEVDAIIDNTQTGSTIRANNLKIVDVIDHSTAVLIANKNALKDDWKREKIKDLKVLLLGVIEASKKLHIFMNVKKENLPKILNELPALKRPTISELAGDSDGWLAVNTIIKKSEFINLIPFLRKYAQGLVVHEPRQIIPLKLMNED